MKNNIEVLFDSTPNEGCGCNCGCAGSSIVDEVNELVENLKSYEFKSELQISLLSVSDLDNNTVISKMNSVLDKTNAAFRVTEENKDQILSDLLPIITIDGKIITAFGVPTLNEVIDGVQKHL